MAQKKINYVQQTLLIGLIYIIMGQTTALHAKDFWGPFIGGVGTGVVGTKLFSGRNRERHCQEQPRVIERQVVQPVYTPIPVDTNLSREMQELKEQMRELKRNSRNLQEELDEKQEQIDTFKKENRRLKAKNQELEEELLQEKEASIKKDTALPAAKAVKTDI